MADYLGDGIYRIGKAERIWSCRKAVMDDAVAEVEPGIPPANARFGWFKGAIPTPPTGGFYVVEFLDDQKIRVIAYVDMYGRAFTTEIGFERPPAKPQDLFIAFAESSSNKGTIFAQGQDDSPIACASFTKSGSGQNAKYTINETWYDFNNCGNRLHYYDLMTRAYLAFVYRPTLGKAALPYGIDDVYRTLAHNNLLPAIEEIIARAGKAEEDHLITVHPAVSKLRQRLIAANALTLAQQNNDDAIRLIRTVNYANTFYLQSTDEKISEAQLWEIEAALNIFSLTDSLLQTLIANGDLASLAGCEKYLLETAASQTVDLELVSEMPEGKPTGEWQTRSRIAAGIENMALPLRVDAQFILDLPKGIVKFEMNVPGAGIISSLFDISTKEAADTAKNYAMRAGLLLVDIAMRASARIEQVRLCAHTIDHDNSEHNNSEELFYASFDRDLYESCNQFESERKGGALAVFENRISDSRINSSRDTFASIIETPIVETSPYEVCNLYDAEFSSEAKSVFSAETLHNLEVKFDAELRLLAENIADSIASAKDMQEAISIAQLIEKEVCAQNTNERISEAFKRLLKAMSEGLIDLHEQNSTVNCILEEDVCMQAYLRARELTETGSPDKAMQLLKSTIENIEESGQFTDNETTVYRVFESYSSRLIYNKVKAGELSVSADCPILEDKGRKTELAPDGYSFCLLEMANLLCESGWDIAATQYAEKAIKVTPTMSAGYRTLARAYALKEDHERVKAILGNALSLMTLPENIAILYYHLAYSYWKSGNPEAGLACYIKSIMTSDVIREQCIAEIEDLQKETSFVLPENNEIDVLLEKAGIPLAPTKDVQTTVEMGAIAALDEGLFDIACSFLPFVIRCNNDDALIGVLRSLLLNSFRPSSLSMQE